MEKRKSMSYCVKCGHELIEKENGIDGMVPYCPNCHEFRFPMFNSAVSALVLNPKKDKILLIQQYGHKDNILILDMSQKEKMRSRLFLEKSKKKQVLLFLPMNSMTMNTMLVLIHILITISLL